MIIGAPRAAQPSPLCASPPPPHSTAASAASCSAAPADIGRGVLVRAVGSGSTARRMIAAIWSLNTTFLVVQYLPLFSQGSALQLLLE
jgi:hypothetical protein